VLAGHEIHHLLVAFDAVLGDEQADGRLVMENGCM